MILRFSYAGISSQPWRTAGSESIEDIDQHMCMQLWAVQVRITIPERQLLLG